MDCGSASKEKEELMSPLRVSEAKMGKECRVSHFGILCISQVNLFPLLGSREFKASSVHILI
jgi:hypothetical protein